MSNENWCRLCINRCSDFLKLYDENDRCKIDVYEMAIKYFNPMFLEPITESPLKVMCLDCWRQMSQFYNFQMSIELAQMELQKNCCVPKETINTESAADIAHKANNNEYGINVKEELHIMDVHQNVVVKSSNDERHPSSPLRFKDDLTKQEAANISQPSENDDNHNSSYLDIKPTLLNENTDDFEDAVGIFSGGEFGGPPDQSYVTNTPSEFNSTQLDHMDEMSATFADEYICLSESDSREEGENDIDALIEARNKGYGPQTNIFTEYSNKRKRTEDFDQYITKWRATLYCPICNEASRDFSYLNKHFKLCHPLEKSHIQCCQRKFYTRSSVVEHARIHFDPNSFICELCGTTWGSRPALQKHKHRNHLESKEVCVPKQTTTTKSTIGKKTKQELDDIIAKWKPILQCVVCSGQYPNFTRLYKHFQFEHPTDKFYIECCQQKLKERWQTADHMQLHTNPNAFNCQLCNRSYPDSRILYRHKYYAHSKTSGGDRVKTLFKCTFCDKSFQARITWKEHMAKHTDEKLYQCSLCPDTFRYRATLYSHLRGVHPLEWQTRKNNQSVFKAIAIN